MPMPSGKDVDAKVKLDLNKASVTQLNDIYDRQSKLVKNTKFLSSLPDKGAKILKFHDEVELALAKAKERELMDKNFLQSSVPVASEGFTSEVYNHVHEVLFPEPLSPDCDTSMYAEISVKSPEPQKKEQHSELPVMNEPVLDIEASVSCVESSQSSMDASFTSCKSEQDNEHKYPHIYMHYSKPIHDQDDNAKRKFKTNEPLRRSTASVTPSPAGKSPFKYYEALAPPSTTKTAILLPLQDSLALLNQQTQTQARLEFEAAEKCLKTWQHVIHGEATPASGVKNLGVKFRIPVDADLDTDEEEDLLTDEEDRITEESEPEGDGEEDRKNAEFLSRLVNASVDLS